MATPLVETAEVEEEGSESDVPEDPDPAVEVADVPELVVVLLE